MIQDLNICEMKTTISQKHSSWTGKFSEEEQRLPGDPLLAMIRAKAAEKGDNFQVMAAHLGVTYGYISQLRMGRRKIKHISDAFANACALYLGVPRLTILLASGKVRPDDFYEEPHRLAQQIPDAMTLIAKDPEWGVYLTPELKSSTLDSQYFIVRLYEEATKKQLLPGRVDAEELAKSIEALQQLRQDLKKSIDEETETKKARHIQVDEARNESKFQS